MANQTPTTTSIPEQLQLGNRLEGIFMPFARQQRDRAYKNQERPTRFVHYTSAEAALSIIRSKRIWMRNTTCMSDYREVHHGYEILSRFFNDPPKLDAFITALDNCCPGAAREALNLFNQWWNDIQSSTYIFSISEHDDKEDRHGRLSMWRAFGGSVPKVALVFNVPRFSGGALALNLMFSPVAYLTEGEVHAQLQSVIQTSARRSISYVQLFVRSLSEISSPCLSLRSRVLSTRASTRNGNGAPFMRLSAHHRR